MLLICRGFCRDAPVDLLKTWYAVLITSTTCVDPTERFSSGGTNARDPLADSARPSKLCEMVADTAGKGTRCSAKSGCEMPVVGRTRRGNGRTRNAGTAAGWAEGYWLTGSEVSK